MTQEVTQQETQAAVQSDRRTEITPPQLPPYDQRYPATLRDDPLRRSPVLASILAVVPGLGQAYTGYVRLGFVHAIVVAVIITFIAATSAGALIPLAGIFLGFFWLYGIIDAGRRAVLVNQALLGRLDIDLPEAVGEPAFRGSLPGGLAVVALGVILLADTLFDVSLRWVEDWWPAAVIGFGAFLVYRAVQDRQAEQGHPGRMEPSAPEPPADEL